MVRGRPIAVLSWKATKRKEWAAGCFFRWPKPSTVTTRLSWLSGLSGVADFVEAAGNAAALDDRTSTSKAVFVLM